MLVPEGTYADVGDGLRIHYQEAGPAGGRPVVFLHGSGPGASGWSNFRRNIPFLAGRGHRVLAPDTLGYGHSSKPEDRDYDLDYLVGAAKRFLDAVGVDRCAVIGNSHGGAMAIQLALDQPERVSRLVLMAPGGLEERETYMKMDGIVSMMKLVLGREGITRDGLARVLGLQLFDRAKLTDDIIDERFEIARTQPRRVLATMKVPHLAPRLGELRCPVFGLWGMNDRFCPPSGAQAIAAGCADARVMTLTRCGHWVMVEYPELFNRLCADFLNEAT
jgi:4,5:9,10-diseco-3-hydroxy-5,9,17-trioxoandrosta-1(10),2-diene-4-oate hydrolase